jgi:hypothetical protein
MKVDEEIKLRVNRLLDLIASTDDMIRMHQSSTSKDSFQIQQYQELKARFEKELLEILSTEMGIRIPVAA